MNFFQKVANAVVSFVSNIWKKAPTVMADAEKAIESATQVAVNVTTAIKNYAASPTGQTIEAVIGTVVPAQWVQGFINVLPTILTYLHLLEVELDKPLRDQINDALLKVNTASADSTAVTWAALQAHSAVHFAGVQGIDYPVQAALTSAHVAYLGLPEDNTQAA